MEVPLLEKNGKFLCAQDNRMKVCFHFVYLCKENGFESIIYLCVSAVKLLLTYCDPMK